MLPQKKGVTFDEFLKMDKQENIRLEYVDGEVYCLASPSEEHQRVLFNLAVRLGNYFSKNKQCTPYFAPFDVTLKNEKEKSTSKVQPDLMVICDKSGLEEKGYTGVPSLIIEVISPNNSSHDYTVKFNLYMRFGVYEYWITNPKTKSIQVFSLDEEGLYDQAGIYKENETLTSVMFQDLTVNLHEIFS